MNAFTFLTENGKFNNSEIMKHAHILKAYRRISLSEALKKLGFWQRDSKKNTERLKRKRNLSNLCSMQAKEMY